MGTADAASHPPHRDAQQLPPPPWVRSPDLLSDGGTVAMTPPKGGAHADGHPPPYALLAAGSGAAAPQPSEEDALSESDGSWRYGQAGRLTPDPINALSRLTPGLRMPPQGKGLTRPLSYGSHHAAQQPQRRPPPPSAAASASEGGAKGMEAAFVQTTLPDRPRPPPPPALAAQQYKQPNPSSPVYTPVDAYPPPRAGVTPRRSPGPHAAPAAGSDSRDRPGTGPYLVPVDPAASCGAGVSAAQGVEASYVHGVTQRKDLEWPEAPPALAAPDKDSVLLAATARAAVMAPMAALGAPLVHAGVPAAFPGVGLDPEVIMYVRRLEQRVEDLGAENARLKANQRQARQQARELAELVHLAARYDRLDPSASPPRPPPPPHALHTPTQRLQFG